MKNKITLLLVVMLTGRKSCGLLSLIILSACSISSFAQTPSWLWAQRMGGTNGDVGHSIALDGSGNIISIGTFSTTADFDPGPGVFNLASAGSIDIYISKLDASGNFIWAKGFGGSGADYSPHLALDAFGNVYMAGWFQGMIDLDPGPGTFYLTSAGFDDGYISKLDASGNFVWAIQLGDINYDITSSITLDASGNIFTVGYFGSTVDFDPGPGIFNLTAIGNNDIFIAKLDSSTNFIWAKGMGGSGGDFGNTIALDASGNVLSSGFFNGVSDFDPGPGTFNIISAGNNDIFISKLDSSGNFVWAKAMGGGQYDQAAAITTDAAGNVFSTGFFSATADFDPGPGTFNLAATGLHDIFISKLDAFGNFVWAKGMGSGANDESYSIVTDIWGNVYFAGAFTGIVDFDPGPGIFNLTSAGNFDVFLCKLEGSGNFVWAKRAGSFYSDGATSLTLDSSRYVYATGHFNSPSISFDLTTLMNTDTSGNQNSGDIFLAKLDSSGGFPTEIEQEIVEINIFCSPNPATNEITIQNTEGRIESVEVWDVVGERVLGLPLNPLKGTSALIDVSKLSAGIYFVKVRRGNGERVAKFVKQ